MATSRTTGWWDREVDERGRRLRPDLRVTAHEIWDWACNTTRSQLGDSSATAELLDSAISQASAYLDKRNTPLGSHSESHLTGLMRRCFWYVLRRHMRQVRRLELIGGQSELGKLVADRSWSLQVDARIDFEKAVRLLSDRARIILVLRDAGYEWSEIALRFGTTVTAVKKSFFRELRDLQLKIDSPAAPPRKT